MAVGDGHGLGHGEVFEHGEKALPRRRPPRVRRILVGLAVVVGLTGAYSYAIVTLIGAPGGNRFRGWPLYVFCAAAAVVSAVGVVVDNRRLAKRREAQGDTDATPLDESSSDATVPTSGTRSP